MWVSRDPTLVLAFLKIPRHLVLLEVSVTNFYDKMTERCRRMSGKCFKFVTHHPTSIKMGIQNPKIRTGVITLFPAGNFSQSNYIF